MRLTNAFASIKLRVVGACVVVGLAAALGAGSAVHRMAEAELLHQIIDNDSDDRERTAGLLGSKLEMLKISLSAAATLLTVDELDDPAAMQRFLAARAGISVLFDDLMVARGDGMVMARIGAGSFTPGRLDIADREYFRQAMRNDQPVVSDPLISRVSGQPAVIVVVPVLGRDGGAVGVVAGVLQLQSNSLFVEPVTSRQGHARDLVIDRSGTILSHTDRRRIMGNAADEPGLGAVFARWHGNGSPIDTRGSAELLQDHVVSTAGIPLSEWMLVRVTPSASALAPLAAARRAAAIAALVAALVSALAAGMVAWALVRPITTLRNRARRMVSEGDDSAKDWPAQGGEVGALSQAFQTLLQVRAGQRAQLQAVLDYAEVGLALTRDGRFELVGRGFCQTLGHKRDGVVGQSTRLIYPSDAAYEAFAARAYPAFMADGHFHGEVELKRADGTLFWARMRGRAVVPGDRSQGTVWAVTDATDERDQRDRLSWAASHDRLTGLMNRAGFEPLLDEAVRQAAGAPFCVLFIDLDRFKHVNDSGGHAAGDALLCGIARTLVAGVRKTDTAARLGGDEFAVLLPRCPIAQARRLAEELRAALAAYQLEWEGTTYNIGASIGVVAVTGAHADTAEVLRAADHACYEAKRAGRNAVAIA